MRRVRFLVIEDDETVGRSMRKLLAPYGETVVVSSARDAGRVLASRSPWTAFFIDLRLPDGSGIDVLAQARLDYPTTPAMVLTGSLESHAVNAAFDLDAELVTKPVVRTRIAHFLLSRRDFVGRLEQTASEWREQYALSDAELDVLRRAASGETRQAIASARSCSLLTIKAHVANLLQKTGDDSLHVAVGRLLRSVAGDEK
jgi:two-component system response regulator DevR